LTLNQDRIIIGAVIGGAVGFVFYKRFGSRSLWRLNPLQTTVAGALFGMVLGFLASISFR